LKERSKREMLVNRNGSRELGKGDRKDERRKFQSKGKHFRKEGEC